MGTGGAWGNCLRKQLGSKDRSSETHLFQPSNSKRVSAADAQVGAIGDATEVRGVVAEGESDFADVLLVGGGVLAGEGGVVVVDFGVEVRHGSEWGGCLLWV